MKSFKQHITEAATLRRKLWVFDFDDTLAVDDTPVDVVDSTGAVVRQVSSLQFKSDSLKDGERYDFRNQARNPKPRAIPATLKIMRQVIGRGGRVVVLTARADGAAIQEWLRGIGMSVEVVPVGRRARGGHEGIARAKRDWLAGEIAQGYNDIEVFEDNALNLKHMKTLASPGTVRLRGRLVRYSAK